MAEQLAFYEFIADPQIAGVVHSMKADAIRVCGQFVAERLTGPRVLDVGCNIGYLSTWYARVHPAIQVTGVDISSASICVRRCKVAPLRR
jgi:2-polyprenyl-3-methyl-5-hydroxy-6-metoxy-1,4-benzoquinol methylase